MPKYGIHQIILDDVIAALSASGNADGMAAAQLLQGHRFEAGLGAIGPDLFFFGVDYDIIGRIKSLGPAVEWLDDMATEVGRIRTKIEGVQTTIGSHVDQTLDALGLRALRDIKKRIDSIETLLEKLESTMIKGGALEGVNPLHPATTLNGTVTSPLARIVREMYENFFIPPLQKNEEETEWYWFDMLHYRRVGAFARRLAERAQTDGQKAYALAYLTHIGADLVGHPYVNQISGGPFRLGVQRHVTAENYMDVAAYRDRGRPPVYQQLAEDVGVHEDNHTDLPDELADLLETAFTDVYGDVLHPRRLEGDGMQSPDDIRLAYTLMRRILKLMGEQESLKPEPPTSTADDDLAEIIALIDELDPPPSPPPLVPPLPGMPDLSPESLFQNGVDFSALNDMLEQIGSSVEEWMDGQIGGLAETAAWAIDTARTLAGLARAIVNTAANFTAQPLLALLYGIELALWGMIRIAHSILARNGITYPLEDDLDDFVSRSLRTVFDPESHVMPKRGTPASRQGRAFPRLRIQGQSHLVRPRHHDEYVPTIPCFHEPVSNEAATPEQFMTEATFDAAALRDYVAAASPQATATLRDDGRWIGNARDLCAWMIQRAFPHAGTVAIDPDLAVVYADWNLDGDRGYGAKSWIGFVPHNADPSPTAQLAIVMGMDGVWDPGAPDPGDVFEPDGQIAPANVPIGMRLTGEDAITDVNDDHFAKIKTRNEQSAQSRTESDLRVANLVISETAIPEPLSTYAVTNAAEWRRILASRLVTVDDRRRCVYHVNGVGTRAYDAMWERLAVEHYLRTGAPDAVAVRLLYNVTDQMLMFVPAGNNVLVDDPDFQSDIVTAGDGIQAISDKLWSYVLIAKSIGTTVLSQVVDALRNPTVLPTGVQPPLPIDNPTTIAVIALLYDAMAQGNPIAFTTYSHGTQIVFNGVAAFLLRGPAERAFVKQFVRVMLFGRMIDENSVEFLRQTTDGVVDFTNVGDPVPTLLGSVPPDAAFLASVAATGLGAPLLALQDVRTALTAYLQIDSEQHKFYLYAPRIKNDTPSQQDFF